MKVEVRPAQDMDFGFPTAEDARRVSALHYAQNAELLERVEETICDAASLGARTAAICVEFDQCLALLRFLRYHDYEVSTDVDPGSDSEQSHAVVTIEW